MKEPVLLSDPLAAVPEEGTCTLESWAEANDYDPVKHEYKREDA